jgi:hypothetical protein
MYMHVCMCVECVMEKWEEYVVEKLEELVFMQQFFPFFFAFLHMCEYTEIHRTHARSYTYAYSCVQR